MTWRDTARALRGTRVAGMRVSSAQTRERASGRYMTITWWSGGYGPRLGKMTAALETIMSEPVRATSGGSSLLESTWTFRVGE